MSDVIVIPSVPGREHWVRDCLASIKRPTLVLSQDNWEIDKMRWLLHNTTFDRFLFLADSIVVKDNAFFDMAFSAGPRNVAVCNCPLKFGMYLGVFHRDTIAQLDLPVIADKEHAIAMEVHLAHQVQALDPEAPMLFTDFHDRLSKGTEHRHGRINLVLENDYLIKYKGTWR